MSIRRDLLRLRAARSAAPDAGEATELAAAAELATLSDSVALRIAALVAHVKVRRRAARPPLPRGGPRGSAAAV